MRINDTLRRRATQLVMAAALVVATGARADERSGAFVRIDNDTFTGTDQEYTSGVQFGSTSATAESFESAEFAPRLRWANTVLRRLQPKGFEENNVTWTIGQRMFTPGDGSLSQFSKFCTSASDDGHFGGSIGNLSTFTNAGTGSFTLTHRFEYSR